MTGRRAVRQWDERLSRALQFRPGHVGGRIPSAQPVRRRGGTLRTPSVGATGAPVSPPAFIGMDKNAAGSPGVDAEFYAATGLIATGDPIVVVAFGHGTVATPAGWTPIASGTVTDMGYVVAWVPFAGSLDGSGNYSGPLDLTFPVSATTQLLTFQFTDNGTTPSATAVEYPADASIPAPSTPVGVGAFSVVGIQYDTGWTWSGITIGGTSYTTYSVSRTYSVVGGDTAPGYDATASAITVAGSGTPLPDMVSIMIGWTP